MLAGHRTHLPKLGDGAAGFQLLALIIYPIHSSGPPHGAHAPIAYLWTIVYFQFALSCPHVAPCLAETLHSLTSEPLLAQSRRTSHVEIGSKVRYMRPILT